jgi:hypothetical protein
VISPAQLEDGLRAQVIHGARLGTNLVELGHVELDQVAVALARMHGHPPALRRHFERCDPDIQARLSPVLAARHAVVPIGLLAGDDRRVLLACRDPLDVKALVAIERAMAFGVVIAMAAELRVLYFLERVYRVPRAKRFLRVRRAASQPGIDAGSEGFADAGPGSFPGESSQWHSFEDATGRFRAVGADVHDDDVTSERRRRASTAPPGLFEVDLGLTPFEPPDDFHIEETPVDHIIDPPAHGGFRHPGRASRDAPDEVVPAPVDRPLPLGGEELRRFVETVADDEVPALGRIALVRRAAAPGDRSSEVREAADLATVLGDDATIEECARAIRRGQTRGRIGDLAIGTLRRFGDDLDAAILFLVRGAVAIGWKGFVRDAPGVEIEDLAVPLDVPNLLEASAGEARSLLIDGAHGTEIDRRLWAALGKPTPGQVGVAPVVLVGTVVCLIFGQSRAARPLAPHAELFAAVTQATTTAFARLLRTAQR